MRRIRLVFVLLSVLLLGPMALLVHSALRSTETDERARHRTLAERASDEMERELSRLVQREEARPFGHYRFHFVPPDVAGERYGLSRSPLGEPPAAPFVVGYFEIQPDGSIRSPLIPRDIELARERGEWEPGTATEHFEEVQRIVASTLETGAGRTGSVVATPAPAAAERSAPEPGKTAALEDVAGPAAPERPAPDAYRALLALNRGADGRGDGQLQLRLQLSRLQDGSGFRVAALGAGSDEPLAESQLRFVAPSREESWFDPSAVLRDQVPEARRVGVHPFAGVLADPDHLILLRAASSEGEWYWQGAVVDLASLTTWLDEAVFGDREIESHLARHYLVEGGPAPGPVEGAAAAFVHRFARPFESLAVRMSVFPMASLSGAYVKLLALLVLIMGSAGLYALYRMVEVTVRFAERRSNFAAAVTHELKTPLTAIRMYGEMLRDGMASSEEKRVEYAETITSESERLSRLIHNVLEFSRLEQGRRDVTLVSGKLGPVVADAAHILEPHARRAGFELVVDVDDDLPEVRYDRDALIQVVFNLVDNALKYARDAEERKVVLRCSRVEGGARLAVRDRGPGVSSQHLSRIFEAFYRGEDELTRTTKGTGIGLALVRGLAERMGAAVSSGNASGGGFEVALRFPAAAGAAAG